MIRTYTGTLMNPSLTKATVVLYITDEVKYLAKEEGKKVIYTNVKSWNIVEGGGESLDIEMNTQQYTPIDENHEYLILHFENGEKKIFRNSHVSMFVM